MSVKLQESHKWSVHQIFDWCYSRRARHLSFGADRYFLQLLYRYCSSALYYPYMIHIWYIYLCDSRFKLICILNGKNWAKSTNKGSVKPTSVIKWILSIIKLNYSQLDGSAEQYSARLSQFRAKLSILFARHRESHTRWTTETKRRILPNIKC